MVGASIDLVDQNGLQSRSSGFFGPKTPWKSLENDFLGPTRSKVDVGPEALGNHGMRTATMWCVPPGGVHATCLIGGLASEMGMRPLGTPVRLTDPRRIHPSSPSMPSKAELSRFDAHWAVSCQPSCSQVPGKGHSKNFFGSRVTEAHDE